MRKARLLCAATLSLLGACSFMDSLAQFAVPGSPYVDRAAENAAAGTAPRTVKSGTGFFVTRSGLLLTSAHVVGDCRNITVSREGRVAGHTQLMALDRRDDLALVASDFSPTQIAAMAVPPRLSLGEPLLMAAFPIPETPPFAPVVIRGAFAGNAMARGARAFVVRAAVPQGASGGLAIDHRGSLVGMIEGYDTDNPNLSIVLANSELEAFLAGNGVRLHPPSRSVRVDTLPRFLIEVSALIQCDAARS